jgi:hypothetical protein
MGGFVLASAGRQASTAGSLASSHAFWFGILLACLIVWILPGWVGGILFVIALFASDVLHSIGHGHFTSSDALLLIIGGIGVVVGLWFGRRRGLQHLGEYEFITRWRNVLGIHRWFQAGSA